MNQQQKKIVNEGDKKLYNNFSLLFDKSNNTFLLSINLLKSSMEYFEFFVSNKTNPFIICF